jgi:ribosomal protein S18 acetylase RimI-like enzyme
VGHEIAEPLAPARILAKPRRFAPLRTFSCGLKGTRSEKLVNEWVREIHDGQLRRKENKVLVLEDAQRKLVGISGFRPRLLSGEEMSLSAEGQPVSHYIHMVAVDRRYRGRRLQDGSRPADVLLRSTLDQIKRACGGQMPDVWAIITPENTRAQALFSRHGFHERGRVNNNANEIAFARPAQRSAHAASTVESITRRISRLLGR